MRECTIDMRDLSSWSLNLGRWHGVQVRLHAFFLFFAVFTFFLAAREGHGETLGYAAVALLILFLSVIIHEVGHCLAVVRAGGYPDEVVLGPLGGLVDIRAPHDPVSERLTALGGPIANACTAILCLPVLLLQNVPVLELLNPLRPPRTGFDEEPWLAGLTLVFWINWALAVVNLLPAFPFDGGRILRSLLWPKLKDYRLAAMHVARGAQIVAVLLCIVGVLAVDSNSTEAVPAWVPLVLLSIFLFFGAKQQLEKLAAEELAEGAFDVPEDYLGLADEPAARTHPAEPTWFNKWVSKRRDLKRIRREQLEADEERKADEILARVHAQGMGSISPAERDLLERVSARYRERQRH
jgi:Zn-dependent protease